MRLQVLLRDAIPGVPVLDVLDPTYRACRYRALRTSSRRRVRLNQALFSASFCVRVAMLRAKGILPSDAERIARFTTGPA